MEYFIDLQVGKHQYKGNITIEMYPILTFRALCYKIEYITKMPLEPYGGIYLVISTSDQGNDNLQGILSLSLKHVIHIYM